jgi:uncharacterized coiled-coil DUF342 family protein
MVRLMCSGDRQEVESLKTTLFRAGIRSEIQTNPLADAMGITRLEVLVHERDLVRASKVRQQVDPPGRATGVAADPGIDRSGDGFAEAVGPELVLDPEPRACQVVKPPRAERSSARHQNGAAEPGGEFVQATALLEQEVEELIVRESQLVDRCCSLEEQVKKLDESLAQARVDLAREAANRSGAEGKLAEACEARAALQKEIQALEVRFKASDQALAAAQAQLESQTQEASVQVTRIADLTKEVSSRDAQMERIAESLATARAGIEQEKSLRLAAEQKAGELAAARQVFEAQLAQQAQERDQLLNERQGEHDQLRTCVGKVNDLRTRLRATLEEMPKYTL